MAKKKEDYKSKAITSTIKATSRISLKVPSATDRQHIADIVRVIDIPDDCGNAAQGPALDEQPAGPSAIYERRT